MGESVDEIAEENVHDLRTCGNRIEHTQSSGKTEQPWLAERALAGVWEEYAKRPFVGCDKSVGLRDALLRDEVNLWSMCWSISFADDLLNDLYLGDKLVYFTRSRSTGRESVQEQQYLKSEHCPSASPMVITI